MEVLDFQNGEAVYASVIIPTLNESAYISSTLAQLRQDAPSAVLEFIVVDGGSTDGTVDIVNRIISTDSRVRLVNNPLKRQSAGINAAAAQANSKSNVLVRADAHAVYPRAFLSKLLFQLTHNDCESVVVRLVTRPGNCFQTAVAAVCNSFLGTGGSPHRVGRKSGYVDHGHHAAFRRDVFERLGGYDPNFAANEDAEFDARLIAEGGRIWLDAELQVEYVPRSNLWRLAKQYYMYGRGRAQNVRKNHLIKSRQWIPPVALATGVICSSLIGVWREFLWVPAAYLLVILGVSLSLFAKHRTRCMLISPIVFLIVHVCWAFGFWTRILVFERTNAQWTAKHVL